MWPKLFGVNYLMIIPSFFATNGKAMEYVTHLLFQTRKHLICISNPFVSHILPPFVATKNYHDYPY